MTRDAASWRDEAIAARTRQDLLAARTASSAALELAPDDGMIGFLDAQIAYELGLPAAPLFAAARALMPANRDVLRNEALALASEGQGTAAEALLESALSVEPDWLEGQRVLAALRWTAGAAQDFDAGYSRALKTVPGHAGLWLGWFGALAQVREWSAAGAVLAKAEGAIGRTGRLVTARAFAATESGDTIRAAQLLDELGVTPDPFVALCRIRLALRMGQPEHVEALATPLLSGPAAGQAWPYLGAAWRILGDARGQWLDGSPIYRWEAQPAFSARELTQLATTLDDLHRARAAYADQSVRWGTQTDRSILLRHEPVLQRARTRLMAAIADIVAALPAAREDHPLLGTRRDDLRIAGSWSVRLGPGGQNVAHSHPQGWLSAVFYVAVPPAIEMGDAPAGFLQLGAPPPELGTGLGALAEIAPVAGKLVVFPSTMWHGTVPIQGGNRLNVAFDVVPAS